MNSNKNVIQNDEIKKIFYKKKYQELYRKYRQMEKNNIDLITNLNTINYYKYVKKDRIYKKIKFLNNDINLFCKEKFNKITNNTDSLISILFFTHTWRELDNKNSTSIGGTTNYLIDLVNYLKNRAHIYIVTVINGRYMLVLIDKKKEIVYDLGINVKVKNFEQYDGNFYARIKSIINELQIDIIHINHIIDFPADLSLIASEYRTITSIHDYTFICPKYFMLDIDDKICSFPSFNKCSKCVCFFTQEEYKTRKESVKTILSCSEKVIFPNITVANKFKLLCDLNNYVVNEHGILVNKFKFFEGNNHQYDINDLNVAFVGNVDNHKGGKIVKDVIEQSPKNIKYHLFGFSNDNYFKENSFNFINHGKYNKFYLPYLLKKNNIDLVLFLSRVEETFSYTLSEVALAGVPSLAFDIGAIGDRIKENKFGWVLPITDNPKLIIDKILDIFNNDDYNNLREKLKQYHFLTNEEYANIIFNYYMLKYIPREKKLYHHDRYLKQFWIYTIF